MAYVNHLDLFRAGIPFEGDIDVEHFVTVRNEREAQDRLDFLRSRLVIAELMRRGYDGPALDRMWRAVYRGCLAYGVPVPGALHGHARLLGVEIVTAE